VSADSAQPIASPPPRECLVPGWFGRILIGLSLVIIVLSRILPELDTVPFPFSDRAYCNLFAMIATLVAGLSILTWFCFRSTYPPLARWLTLAAALLVLGVLIVLFRLKEVDGSMILRFEPRWQPVADRRLERITPAGPAQAKLVADEDEDFPQFLGPERNGYLPGPVLARDWNAKPPKLLWKRPIGAGWSSFAVAGDYAFTMEQRGDEEWVACYEAATGEPVWGHAVIARHEDRTAIGGIGPRATPTVHQGRVYVQGGTGIVRCLDGATGRLLWQDDLLARYGLTQVASEMMVAWGRAGSPLVVDDLVVVPAGGPLGQARSLIAYRADTGNVAWEAAGDQISYASPSLATIAGVLQILIVNEKTASGHDPETGRQLWTHPWPGTSNGSASASQAVAIGDSRVFLSKNYGVGAELLEFSRPAVGGTQAFRSVWASNRVLQTKFTNVTIIGEHIYGLSDGILECVELATGKRAWKKGRYGHGQILGVGQLILVQAEEGEVVLVEANPKQLVELTRFQAIEGKTWNNPCLAGRRLFVRNAEQAAAYELP
jgi:outer membrane protein assembly factor BamB